MQSCGKEPNTAHHDESLACVTGSAVPPFTNGQVYHAAVVYDAVARRLTVGLAPGPLAPTLPPPLLSADVDLPALVRPAATARKALDRGLTPGAGSARPPDRSSTWATTAQRSLGSPPQPAA